MVGHDGCSNSDPSLEAGGNNVPLAEQDLRVGSGFLSVVEVFNAHLPANKRISSPSNLAFLDHHIWSIGPETIPEVSCKPKERVAREVEVGISNRKVDSLGASGNASCGTTVERHSLPSRGDSVSYVCLKAWSA